MPLIRGAGTGVALVLAGFVWLLASALAGEGGSKPLVSPDRPVNVGARDPGDIRALNSPTVARNPRNRTTLVVASRVDSPDFSCALHRSDDNGENWVAVTIAVPRGRASKCYTPDVAFSASGVLYLSYVTLGPANKPEALWAVKSEDGGRTLSEPRRVSGPLAFQVRLAAHPSDPDELVLTWLQARDVGPLGEFPAAGNRIVASRSGDAGASWSTPTPVNRPRRGRVLAPSAAIGSRGELHVLYLDVGEDRLDYEGAHENESGPPYSGRFSLVSARSLDGGRTWQESLVDDRVVPIERFIPFIAPSPSLAVDPQSGRLYAAFHDARGGSADVLVWSLAPDGTGWSRPVRVNAAAPGDDTAQYLPALAVAPGGRLDVVYYDRGDDNVRNDVSLQSSDDAGRTFKSRTTLSSRSFDSRIGFGGERGLATLGSRLGLSSEADEVLAVWSDTRAGSQASNKQDLVGAAVALDPEGQVGILRYGGLALVLLGGGLLAAARRRRR